VGDGAPDILQGTLDLMVLKTLDALGPLHGYGIALRIDQISDDVLRLNHGTVYASLVRLRQRGLISAKWGTSENNRRAKYYAITSRGQKRLAADAKEWDTIAGVIGKILQLTSR
jgi:PadR family transcriptional regulator, regulatory protein PadR